MGIYNKVWEAYEKECSSEDIMQLGFNANSGYAYIALENGVTIGSCMGQDVEYIVRNEEREEMFFDSYYGAINYEETKEE